MLTIRDHMGRLEGLKVCIVGDVLHSRVARSNIFGLLKLGAEGLYCGGVLEKRWGFAVKIGDGARRAVDVAAISKDEGIQLVIPSWQVRQSFSIG